MSEKPLKVIAVVAMDEARVIGCRNEIPWRYSEDMKHFAALTTGHTVLMGRKTYESLPPKFRPLPRRKNIVVSRSPERLAGESGIELSTSPLAFIEACRNGETELPSEKLWVIGGEQIYRETLPYWDEVCLTLVQGRHEGDAFFPEFEKEFVLSEKEDRGEFAFLRYLRK